MNTARDISQTSGLPPMLQQYLAYKNRHPDCLLLFQVGDFYEAFFDDAITLSRTLNVTLTTRDKNNPDPIPMAGVPVAVVESYLDRLVQVGLSVAVVSQCSEPQPGKGMVDRKLERLVTPGVRIMAHFDRVESTPAGVAPMVATVFAQDEVQASIAFSDVQSGRIAVREELSLQTIAQELARLGVAEVVLPTELFGKRLDRRSYWVKEVTGVFDEKRVKFRAAPSAEGDQRSLVAIPGFSTLSPATKQAVRLLIGYVDEVTAQQTLSVSEIVRDSLAETMMIDAQAIRSLELLRNTRDGTEARSLISFLDKTVTASGKRLLTAWVVGPLLERASIEARLNFVEALRQESRVREATRHCLKVMSDFERTATRIELEVASPRELEALRDSLEKIPEIEKQLYCIPDQSLILVKALKTGLQAPLEIVEKLAATLADNLPPTLIEGGVIKSGFNPELDRLRGVKEQGSAWIFELESGERERTGINSLKVKYNGVLGYFFEVTAANKDRVPDYFIRRQSTANTERFTTPELRARESEVVGAETKIIPLEKDLFETLRRELKPALKDLRTIGRAIAELDVLTGLAELAASEGLVRPVLDDSRDLVITAGKHPVLSRILGSQFVPNSINLNGAGQYCEIITGPNMGGKSTYLRQVSHIVIMAQIGSFVPAADARIGIVDRIFARIGAGDDLAEGDSTFMVEMREAATIVGQATARSLVVIDEVGRGTATTDGQALAQAILEWLVVKTKCRTLFATHFHELTELQTAYPAIQNMSVGSVERGDTVVFTHELHPGPANKSYGVEVAKLACLPRALIYRAKELLDRAVNSAPESRQLSIFSSPVEIEEVGGAGPGEELLTELAAVDVNAMTPIEALQRLNEFKLRAKNI